MAVVEGEGGRLMRMGDGVQLKVISSVIMPHPGKGLEFIS